MLRSRIIPCLLVRDGGLVKTRQFGDDRYVGDPLNAIKIFNEKQVDELAIFDIDATRLGRAPDLKLIASAADQCRMPLNYGGGVRDPATAAQILRLGVEKISISAAAVKRPALIRETADLIGSQSVTVVIDVKARRFPRKGHEVVTTNATKPTGLDPVEFARKAVSLGAGEIVLNSIDRDGMLNGYDIELARTVRDQIDTPLTVLGGAGSQGDLAALIEAVGPVGAAAGSLFVFRGKFRAVLISYDRPQVADR